MRISIIQETIVWADIQTNLQRFGNIMENLVGKTDLVVLPEMFTTGFCTDKLYLAEKMNGETMRFLTNLSQKCQFAITGSYIGAEDGNVYNRAFFIAPNSEISTADKRHLFSMGGEHKYFSKGDKRLIVSYKGFNICLLVCYDVRFPVWSRNVNNEYDLLIYVANFPQRRIADWDILLRARAIENQSYVCGVNRVGKDELGLEYNGHSVILDAQANVILAFDDNEIAISTAELSKEKLDKFRQKFSVWQDADTFELT